MSLRIFRIRSTLHTACLAVLYCSRYVVYSTQPACLVFPFNLAPTLLSPLLFLLPIHFLPYLPFQVDILRFDGGSQPGAVTVHTLYVYSNTTYLHTGSIFLLPPPPLSGDRYFPHPPTSPSPTISLAKKCSSSSSSCTSSTQSRVVLFHPHRSRRRGESERAFVVQCSASPSSSTSPLIPSAVHSPHESSASFGRLPYALERALPALRARPPMAFLSDLALANDVSLKFLPL